MNPRRGSILVAVLVMASLLVVFVGVAGERLRVASAAARSAAEDVAADVAVRGAVEVLFARGGGRFSGGGGVETVSFPGLVVEARATEESRRIDLNTADRALLAGLFRAVGVDARAAEFDAQVIVDWRRDPTRRPVGRTAPTVPPHGVVEHLRELDRLPQIPPETLRRILPFVTVTGLGGRVDPLIAPPQVIAALPGMNPERVAAFLQDRQSWSGTFAELMKRYGIKEDHVSKDGSTATRLALTVRIGAHRVRGYELVVAVLPGDSEPYRILAWDGQAAIGGATGE